MSEQYSISAEQRKAIEITINFLTSHSNHFTFSTARDLRSIYDDCYTKEDDSKFEVGDKVYKYEKSGIVTNKKQLIDSNEWIYNIDYDVWLLEDVLSKQPIRKVLAVGDNVWVDNKYAGTINAIYDNWHDLVEKTDRLSFLYISPEKWLEIQDEPFSETEINNTQWASVKLRMGAIWSSVNRLELDN